jgi:excinuclease UvrABC nuclease subunit
VKLVFEEFSHAHPDTPLPILTALAKREEILITDRGAIPLKKQHRTILHLFQRIRDESHRFARVYHHLLRSKSYVRSR